MQQNNNEHVASRVRPLLNTEDNNACDDEMIARYCRAVNNDVPHAVRRLRSTLDWWKREQPSKIICPACIQVPHSHYMHCVAFDKSKRPTIYSCMKLATNKDIEHNRKHMISVFEAAIQLMEPGVEQWCWILDFYGFSIRDCDPRLSRVFLNLAASHYPERLGNFFIIDAPSVFSTLWKAIVNFIDPKTRKKISFLNLKQKRETIDVFLEFFDEETVDWLMNEMQDNRVPGRAAVKYYNYAAVANMNTIGNSHGSSEDVGVNHNNLGAPAFRKVLQQKAPPQYKLMSSAMS